MNPDLHRGQATFATSHVDDGAATGRPERPGLRSVEIIVLVVVAAMAWWFVRSSPEERSARADADAVGAAVAGYVAAHGRLPRVAVTPLIAASGDVQWGEDFLVESGHIPRADPGKARGFYVVGDAADWCIEMVFEAPRFLEDSSPPAWVAVKGEIGVPGRVVDGRCGAGYVLSLSPVTIVEVPEPGSVVDAAGAPAGTCTADPYAGEPPPGDPQLAGVIEVADCARAHFGEIYHSGEIEMGDYALYQDSAAESCAALFESFVGVPRSLSELTPEAYTVSNARWEAGERSFNCVLFSGNQYYPLVGSARDSWR